MAPKTECPYGRCVMRNLCKGSHCVRESLARDGLGPDGNGNIVSLPEERAAITREPINEFNMTADGFGYRGTPMGSRSQQVRLDLGAGARSPEGFTPLGNAHGSGIFPLPYSDGTVDEIRASHVLEHFPHAQVSAVLADWVRVLKPGGLLRIAVPDFGKIADAYVSGAKQNTLGYVMGGQTDEADFHKTLFDSEQLKLMLAQAGLMLIRPWESELTDCASLPISLNLGGVKPHQKELGVTAIMSVPRLGFMDNWFASFEALPPLNIKMRRYTGAFWSQCIERVFEETLKEKPDAILTSDYDSVYVRNNVSMLIQLMCCHPEADAIASVQSGRGKMGPLFTVKGRDGANVAGLPRSHFAGDLSLASTAHFGLTLLRADKIEKLKKPWFQDLPAPDGSWNDGHIDADINFWRLWGLAGNSLYIANRVPIGHMDLSVRWPGADLSAVHQPIEDWRTAGKPPEGAWS